MAAVVLEKQAIQGSTYIVRGAFTDEDGGAVVPDSLTWTLKDESGTVINSREAVAATPATIVDFVLKGADLAPGTDDVAKLLFTINATYTSALGSGLPFIDQCWILLATQEPSD